MEKRIKWVDYVKLVGCILVVLGHFFQSMIEASILAENDLYEWFIQTIYYFHVPLFFICSGFIYQKFSIVTDMEMWGRNVLKKLIVLGIPYLFFSSVTWALKLVFSDTVNSKIEEGFIYTLFLHPISPYWYLYCLFLLFLITPTISEQKDAEIILTIAVMGKSLSFISGGGILF